MAKDRILESLGEGQLLLPGSMASALAANDRVKYLLTLLQTARRAADGAAGAPSLREERLASGVNDSALDHVVAESAREADRRYRIPNASVLADQAITEVETMLMPLHVAQVQAAPTLAKRVEAVSEGLEASGDLIGSEDITRLTAPRGEAEDSLHLIVIDAHRELNALEARIATESIDGAHAHDISPEDQALVRAFMRGVHATERLKLDHPGLGTLATRTGSALVIQNDLGETDAHVVVIRITCTAVTITYTDVHLRRLLFFQDLLAAWRLTWEDTRSRSDKAMEGGMYHLASGQFEAHDSVELERFLEHFGSRLVFIIDWNRARKRLRRLVGRRTAIGLLRWAADQGYGHVAFLRAGGDGLVYDALEFAGGRVARAGESLQDVLGADAAEAYLRAVLRICSDGLLAGKSVSLVRDEVRAELTGYLRSARQEILMLALRQSELGVEIAEAARDGLEHAITGAGDRRARVAARAANAERGADELVTQARAAVARAPDLQPFLTLIEAADDIADCAEEAAFYATLLEPGQPTGAVRVQVRRIARLVLTAAREYLRAVQLCFDLGRGAPREEMDAFLEAVHRTIALERETDAAQRAVHQALVAEGQASGVTLFVVAELTRSFEEAADALMHSTQLLRDRTLGGMVRSESLTARALDRPSPRVGVKPAVGEHVYLLGDPDVAVPDVTVIGGKAHGLALISRAGLPVPEGAVLKTSLWRSRTRSSLGDQGLREVLSGAVEALEQRTGLRLGSSRRPLLLSVRSGAPVSMPGMLDTVLDVGINDTSLRGIIALTGNPRLAWDSYRRFVEAFAAVVHGCAREPFEAALRDRLEAEQALNPTELTASTLERLARDHRQRFVELTGHDLPQDPMDQLVAAVGAVFASWDAPRAREYRRLHGISDDLGTAVILQRMVFGNAGGVSGAGVGFTRDPSLGERRLYMDFLVNAQGEDVVGGRHDADQADELGVIAPEVLAEIERLCPVLERELGDAQEFELTIQDGELFVLQSRTAKRTPWAALRIATDQVHEGLITEQTALERLEDLDLTAIRRTHVDASEADVICHAIPASVGVATGPLALDRESADRIARGGTPPVLVRPDTLTEEVAAIAVAAGLLTGHGSRTSHAAVVARELGKPCLVGCHELDLDLTARTARIGGRMFAEGDLLCLDAEAGLVYGGAPRVIEERPIRELAELEAWQAASSANNEASRG